LKTLTENILFLDDLFISAIFNGSRMDGREIEVRMDRSAGER